jgi:hypothetical protein
MVQSRVDSSPSRIELVVLACLSQSTPPSDGELGDALQQLALPRESAAVARQRAIDVLARLVQRGWATGENAPPTRKRRKPPSPRKLTDDGKRVLRDALKLTRTPTWGQVRDKHLPALGIAVSPGVVVAGASLTEAALMAAVLGARFGVRGASTATGLCDALIAGALGMPAGKLTLDRMRAHVLQRGIDRSVGGVPEPGSKGYPIKLATWIACTAVGASGTSRNKMARAFARRWVCEEGPLVVGAPVVAPAPPVVLPVPPTTGSKAPAVTPMPGTNGAKPAPVAPLPAAELLDVVRDAIPRVGSEGRFGEKVYVSAIWRSIERDRKAGELSLDHFKSWLVGANRNGWLVLARADLIGAMDAKQVNDSEIHDRGATFHFVLDQRTGASAQRGNHAG